jgi:hypothetical protein
MTRMVERFPIMLAAEILPPELPHAGIPRSGGGPGGQFMPILGAALLIVGPAVVLIALSRRQKRKRKVHLPRNPTLADTGGLPPPRQP